MPIDAATPKKLERKLAASLAADVVGYSRLRGADEEDTFERLKMYRHDHIEPEVVLQCYLASASPAKASTLGLLSHPSRNFGCGRDRPDDGNKVLGQGLLRDSFGSFGQSQSEAEYKQQVGHRVLHRRLFATNS
jgi:hypothetical protein